MLQITRIYKNAAGEELRIDTITLTRKRSRIVKSGLMATGAPDVFERNVRIIKLYSSADREVSLIELIGNFNDTESVSGNYLWATFDSPVARVSMNDLPKKTDDV